MLVAGLIYKRKKTKAAAIIALICGTLTMTVAMVCWNLIFTPLFMGAPLQAVIDILAPAIIPFNLLKAGINSIIAFLVFNIIKKALVCRS